MAQAGRDESAVDAGMQLDARDKIVICLVIFFNAIALTFELYWLIFNQAMENRSDLLARAIALYWLADSTYRVPGLSVASPLPSRSKASTLSSRRAFRLCSSGLFSRVGHSVMPCSSPSRPTRFIACCSITLSRTFPGTQSLRIRMQPHSCCSIC